MEVVIGKQRGAMARDAAGLPDKKLQPLAGFAADRVSVSGDEAVERSVTAHEFSEIGLNRLAVVDQDAVDDLLVGGIQAVPVRRFDGGGAGGGETLVIRQRRIERPFRKGLVVVGAIVLKDNVGQLQP